MKILIDGIKVLMLILLFFYDEGSFWYLTQQEYMRAKPTHMCTEQASSGIQTHTLRSKSRPYACNQILMLIYLYQDFIGSN